MLNLREKARVSLTQHRHSPPTRQNTQSEPPTPNDDNDELSVLGGKTRLVASKEKSMSPIIGELSPTSQNPIVPFPMRQDLDGQAHPYVLEYLRSFTSQQVNGSHQHQPQAPSPFDHTAFANMTPLSAAPQSFVSAGDSPFPPQPTMSPLEGMSQSAVPQYFPVFDYGYGGSSEPFAMSPETEIIGRSYSPDTNMQSAWQDFVAQIGHL